MPSNNKIRKQLWVYKNRSCNCKKNYRLLKGLYRLFLFKIIKNNGNLALYKCIYGNHYHIGNIGKNTMKHFRRSKNLQNRLGVEK